MPRAKPGTPKRKVTIPDCALSDTATAAIADILCINEEDEPDTLADVKASIEGAIKLYYMRKEQNLPTPAQMRAAIEPIGKAAKSLLDAFGKADFVSVGYLESHGFGNFDDLASLFSLSHAADRALVKLKKAEPRGRPGQNRLRGLIYFLLQDFHKYAYLYEVPQAEQTKMLRRFIHVILDDANIPHPDPDSRQFDTLLKGPATLP